MYIATYVIIYDLYTAIQCMINSLCLIQKRQPMFKTTFTCVPQTLSLLFIRVHMCVVLQTTGRYIQRSMAILKFKFQLCRICRIQIAAILHFTDLYYVVTQISM